MSTKKLHLKKIPMVVAGEKARERFLVPYYIEVHSTAETELFRFTTLEMEI